MAKKSSKFEDYFSHLKQISFLGHVYKRYILSPVLLRCAHRFGSRVMEVGSGVGSGVLGANPDSVDGLDINPEAVEYCKTLDLNARLINDDGGFPIADAQYDSCVLDNVIEHIVEPRLTLDECYRITKKNGGLVIAVPGMRGFQSDSDHKKFYGEGDLRMLDERWQLESLFSTPFLYKNEKLSLLFKQYCLVATYKKVELG